MLAIEQLGPQEHLVRKLKSVIDFHSLPYTLYNVTNRWKTQRAKRRWNVSLLFAKEKHVRWTTLRGIKKMVHARDASFCYLEN